ncbi:hypothetical protein C2869_12745 [Saccharobesus litoralis]|uniref:PilZ domain-containing protein n=1 Tax=Saccharobesus litoralis TaxID=2172099 RepID=A0A2S0VST8_9ALTE|nr:PilZ domain-containing protein [Saccharobesus litoralis]AWB67253.1 hypothetical protein C2869_12745 [Saccharobesus litoralis]
MSLPRVVGELLEQLTPKLGHPKFNLLLKQVSQELSDSDRFLLKMELSRLAKPCLRPIDLRDKSPEPCQLVSIAKVNHYLPSSAAEQLKALIQSYQGVYNFAAYESIMRQFKLKPQTVFESKAQQTEVEQTLALPIIFGRRITRRDERMHYVTDLGFHTRAGAFKAKTRDISASGLQIKLPKTAILETNGLIEVNFLEFAKQYQRDFAFKLTYKVCWQRQEKGENFAGLAVDNEKQNPALIEFLTKFVKGYRRKYRLDACNTLDAARNKLFEQFYFYGSQALPMLLNVQGMQVEVNYLCAQKANQAIRQYWLNEQRHSQLSEVLTAERLLQATDNVGQVKTLYLYSFTHDQNQQHHFFTSTPEELAEAKMTDLFYHFGATKPSWRVFKLQFAELEHAKAWNPVAIPEEAGREIQKRNRPLSTTLQNKLFESNYYALLIDVTNELAKPSYHARPFDKSLLNQLNQFHVKREIDNPAQEVEFSLLGQRKEPRYNYRTVVEVDTGQQFISGLTKNISANGLQIEFEESAKLDAGQVIYLDFPELQLTTCDYKLTHLPYIVVATNKAKTVFNFKAKPGKHQGRKFFTKLSQRKEALNQGNDKRIIGLEDALHNLFIYSTSQCCAYISQVDDDSQCFLACAPVATRLNALIDRCRELNSQLIELALLDKFASFYPADEQTDFAEMVIAVNANKIEFLGWLSEMTSESDRKNALTDWLKDKVIWVLRVDVAIACPADFRHIELENSYLSTYQPAAQKMLEKLAKGVRLTLQVTDISQEVCLRYNKPLEQFKSLIEKQNNIVFDVLN